MNQRAPLHQWIKGTQRKVFHALSMEGKGFYTIIIANLLHGIR